MKFSFVSKKYKWHLFYCFLYIPISKLVNHFKWHLSLFLLWKPMRFEIGDILRQNKKRKERKKIVTWKTKIICCCHFQIKKLRFLTFLNWQEQQKAHYWLKYNVKKFLTPVLEFFGSRNYPLIWRNFFFQKKSFCWLFCCQSRKDWRRNFTVSRKSERRQHDDFRSFQRR